MVWLRSAARAIIHPGMWMVILGPVGAMLGGLAALAVHRRRWEWAVACGGLGTACGIAGYLGCVMLGLAGADAHKYGLSGVPSAVAVLDGLYLLVLFALAVSPVAIAVAYFRRRSSRARQRQGWME